MGYEPCCWGNQHGGEIWGLMWKCAIHQQAHARKPVHSMGWLSSGAGNSEDFFCPLLLALSAFFPHPNKNASGIRERTLFASSGQKNLISGILKAHLLIYLQQSSLTQFQVLCSCDLRGGECQSPLLACPSFLFSFLPKLFSVLPLAPGQG